MRTTAITAGKTKAMFGWRMRLLLAAVLAGIIGLMWLQESGSIGAQEAEVTLRPYVTVVVADDLSDPDNPGSSLTITFNPNYPPDYTCTRGGFNAYISNWLDGFSGIPKRHLGWAATDATQITSTISNLAGEGLVFDVEVFCGTDTTGLLVSWAKVPHDKSSTSTVSNRRLVPGTYSSEPPLTSLTVSSGTLSPTFHSHTYKYTAPDLTNAENRVTITTTAKPGYSITFIKFVTAYSGEVHCPWASGVCTVTWRDSSNNVVDFLTDADADTDGFQIDLDVGETKIVMDVYEGGIGTGNSRGYGVTVTRAANTPATGAPTISGTAQVGQTLTVDTSGIADADGLTNVSYSYQWLSSRDTEIDGATSSTYTLQASGEGKVIAVRVSFTDAAGNEETLTSAATAVVEARPNSLATGEPTISGTVQVRETLTASSSGIADTDGSTNVSYSYQWIRNDGSADTVIQDAAGSGYTLVDADEGKTIKVKVTFTDDGGNEESLTSAATTAVAAAVPGIPGSLTVSVNDTGKLDLSWEAPDSNGGSAVTGYRVQWKEAVGSWDTPEDVSEATVTGTSHTATGLTDGVEYTFRVFAVNTVGDSTASEEESGAPKETSVPTVSSATVDGATLILTFSEGLTETPLPAVTTFTVTVGGNQRGVDSLAISGSTLTLTLASAMTSSEQVSISYTVPSDAAAARLKDLSDNSVASFAAQAVTNNTAAAQTLLTASFHSEPASHDGQAEFTFELRFSENLEGFSYRTLRDHAFTVTGGEVQEARRLVRGSNTRWETRINPTSNADVTIVLPITTVCTANGAICTGDGRKLSNRLELTVSGPTSQQQENSAATGSPTISGTVQVGQTLTVSTSGISDSDGLTNPSYSYQWVRNDGTSDSDIADATASTYALVDGDAGKTIKVQVTFTDDAGHEETLTSTATASVEARPNSPATGAPTISGTVQFGETLTANTSGITDTDGLANVSYSYQWIRNDGSADTDIQDATGSGYTLVDADAGKTIKVRVTFTDDAGHEETLTSAATASVARAPEPITVTLENNPASHNGTDEFTFQIRFSEQFELSYKTLRDHAFTVVGGTVKKAQRQVKGSNIGWTITVEPASNAGVEIVLPATTDCGATGAICTADGRKLSNSLDFTVVGPGE